MCREAARTRATTDAGAHRFCEIDYVVRADSVEWQPALDVTVLGLAGIALAALITMTVGGAIRRHRR